MLANKNKITLIEDNAIYFDNFTKNNGKKKRRGEIVEPKILEEKNSRQLRDRGLICYRFCLRLGLQLEAILGAKMAQERGTIPVVRPKNSSGAL